MACVASQHLHDAMLAVDRRRADCVQIGLSGNYLSPVVVCEDADEPSWRAVIGAVTP
jgi:hypothetical protein